MDWINIIQNVGVLFGGAGVGSVITWFSKNGRKRDKADADAKIAEAQRLMIDNYEERIKDLHSTIGMMNDSEKHYIERISQQNHAIDGKTEQIRNLTDKLYESESRLNIANEKITALTEQRDMERSRKEYYRRWRCEKSICNDPDGRRPPNEKLATEKYASPE